jgi:protein SCO1/2
MKTLPIFLFAVTSSLSFISSALLQTESFREKNNAKVTKQTREYRKCCTVGDATQNPLPGNSIYQLKSNWKNQDGKVVNLSALRGKIEVIAMFYSNCTYACPLTINDMKKIDYNLPKALRKNVGFVLVSFDSKRDTPRVLKTVAKDQQLEEMANFDDTPHWQLLTGRSSDVRSLAAVLGVKYKRQSNGDFLHSSQITVLNTKGEIVYKHIGLNQSIDDVVHAVEECSEQK